MQLQRAQAIALEVKRLLFPFCARIEIAGSIRRRKPEVNDIEIVCIPMLKPVKVISYDLFAEEKTVIQRDPGFVSTVEQWKKVKGKRQLENTHSA